MNQPRPVHVKRTIIALALLLAYFAYTYTRDPSARGLRMFEGATMGTTYQVKIAAFQGGRSDLKKLKARVEERLTELNRQMSPWIAESEINAFNAYQPSLPFRVSREFAEVARFSVQLSKDTGGAFDPTLGPLIDLWGFGTSPRRATPPTPEEVAKAKAVCGARHLSVPALQQLIKNRSALQLNLSAVAKGYAVDDVFRQVLEAGQSNCYVEIGGEVRVLGHNAQGEPWRIGIETPAPEAGRKTPPLRILALTNAAVATSGDYRNFFEAPDGRRFSHILDPRTGYPITNAVAEVSVVAATCMEADGIATALMVMAPDEGLAWVNARTNVAAMILSHGPDGTWETRESDGFARFAQPE